jgi:sugar phosphate permease
MNRLAAFSLHMLLKTEWRFLLFGFLMSFWSSLGQTFFISLFSSEIRADLSLSHGSFGSYYALATTASALTLFWLGKLADTISVPRLSIMTLGGVCLAAVHFSFVSSVVMLTIGIYFLRLSGQGMMYHVYSTAVTRRYRQVRGRALAISGFGMNAAEALFPVVIILGLSLFDWRFIWAMLPVFAFISFAPAIPYLTRRTALQDGPGRGGKPENLQELENQPVQESDPHPSMQRRQVVRDSAFWAVIIWLMMIPGFTVTGLFFHQIHIASEKDIPLFIWTSNYIWYALAAICGALISGMLVDRFSAHRSAVVAQIPMILACLVLMISDSYLTLAVFFVLFGCAGGMGQPLVNALLAERYGTKWLGEIKALASPLNVFSSALSPAVMGILFDVGAELNQVLGLLLALSCFSFLMPLIWFNLLGRIGVRP